MATSRRVRSDHGVGPSGRCVPLVVLAFLLALSPAGAQEALGSLRAEYYDLLALAGLAESPTLAYRTLSDDRWTIPDSGHPWASILTGRDRFRFGAPGARIYGPNVSGSWNSAYPHGMNDGALWQGVGFNLAGSAGVRLEAFGFEATFKPTMSWMQNLDFPTLIPTRNAKPYGPFWRLTIDSYQRPGAASLWIRDWGDSEIRFALGPVTAGFGTQNVWMGPARRNPLMHSNNAEPYPKVDIGLRKTRTPIGDIEARLFVGLLTESDWFDYNTRNDRSQVTGLSVSWAPSFLGGLDVAAHRIILNRWTGSVSWGAVGTILFPWFTDDIATDDSDQRASVSARYRIPGAGAEVYAEWGRNDFSTGLDFLIRYPFHTEAWTLGFRKAVDLAGGRWKGEVLLEASSLESSRDYEFIGSTTFYEHGRVVQGHTNRGQVFGAGIGTGSNSQYLGFSLYHGTGRARAYIQRLNRNNDYVYFLDFGNIEEKLKNPGRFNAETTVGISTDWFLGKHVLVNAGIAWCHNQNVLYRRLAGGEDRSELLPSLRLEFGLALTL